MRKIIVDIVIRCFFIVVIAGAFQCARAQSPGGIPKCQRPNGLKDSEISDVLASHNKARQDLKLPALVWDCSLADLAQQWASRGIAEHRTDTELGESIFVAAAADVTAVTAVLRWMLESTDWDNKTGSCKAGRICTHYTQIVWKRSVKVGCGINRKASGKWTTILVCNYSPAGNWPGPAY
jgi:pathogenesis-related protein 1